MNTEQVHPQQLPSGDLKYPKAIYRGEISGERGAFAIVNDADQERAQRQAWGQDDEGKLLPDAPKKEAGSETVGKNAEKTQEQLAAEEDARQQAEVDASKATRQNLSNQAKK